MKWTTEIQVIIHRQAAGPLGEQTQGAKPLVLTYLLECEQYLPWLENEGT